MYNETADLRRNIQGVGDAYTSGELTEFLKEASTELTVNVGRYYSETYMSPTKKLTLKFKDIISFNKVVVVHSDSVVPSEQYSVSSGVIEFDEDYFDEYIDGYAIKVFYEPEAFKYLELLYATRGVLERVMFQTNDELIGVKQQKVSDRIKRLEAKLNSTRGTTTSVVTGKSGLPLRRRFL